MTDYAFSYGASSAIQKTPNRFVAFTEFRSYLLVSRELDPQTDQIHGPHLILASRFFSNLCGFAPLR
jgi:hypothetical protein